MSKLYVLDRKLFKQLLPLENKIPSDGARLVFVMGEERKSISKDIGDYMSEYGAVLPNDVYSAVDRAWATVYFPSNEHLVVSSGAPALPDTIKYEGIIMASTESILKTALWKLGAHIGEQVGEPNQQGPIAPQEVDVAAALQGS